MFLVFALSVCQEAKSKPASRSAASRSRVHVHVVDSSARGALGGGVGEGRCACVRACVAECQCGIQ